MGWFIKISRALVQRNLISYSCSCTCFPGRLPRTVQERHVSSLFSPLQLPSLVLPTPLLRRSFSSLYDAPSGPLSTRRESPENPAAERARPNLPTSSWRRPTQRHESPPPNASPNLNPYLPTPPWRNRVAQTSPFRPSPANGQLVLT